MLNTGQGVGRDDGSIAALFRAIDVNNDGKISRTEWRQGYARFLATERQLAQKKAAAEERVDAKIWGKSTEKKGSPWASPFA